jgi:hypothetical protein
MINTPGTYSDIDAADPYTWWRNSLEGNFGPIHENKPQCGFYRTKNGRAVSIFHENGELCALINDKSTGRDETADPYALWTWVCRNPVSYERHLDYIDDGQWSDDPPPIGHNSREMDPFKILQRELEDEAETIADFMKKPVEDKVTADKVGVWAKRIGDLSNRADHEFEKEKRPHLEAGRAVDEKWRSLRADAKSLGAKLKKHVESFLIAEKRRVEEAATPQKIQAGRTGAKVSLRTETEYSVSDLAAVAAHYVQLENVELSALLLKIAKQDIKAGRQIPGISIETKEKVV